MDEIDRKIVFLLLDNAKLSLQNIADVLGISKATVGNRLKNLEGNVILGYKARVDFSLLSMDEIFLGLDISPENYMDAVEQIKKFDFVKELYLTSGDHVAIARIVAEKDRTKEIMEKLGSVEGIRKMYPAFVQKIIK